MRSPSLVKDLCLAMRDGAGGETPITVKCRIGVDNDESYEQLAAFVDQVGGRRLICTSMAFCVLCRRVCRFTLEGFGTCTEVNMDI